MRAIVLTYLLLIPLACFAADVDAQSAVARANRPISQTAVTATATKIQDAAIPKESAVKILYAFSLTESRRDALGSALEAYVTAVRTQANLLDRMEKYLRVVDTAKQLHAALDKLDSETAPFSLIAQTEVESTHDFVTKKRGPVVRVAEEEHLFGLDANVAEALFERLHENNSAFRTAYQALGGSLVEKYGSDVIAEVTKQR